MVSSIRPVIMLTKFSDNNKTPHTHTINIGKDQFLVWNVQNESLIIFINTGSRPLLSAEGRASAWCEK